MALSLGIVIGVGTSILVIGFLIFLLVVFNNYIKLKNLVQKSYANIDVLLKQRNDEIPNLIEIVKGFIHHEKEVLENITKTRAAIIGIKDDIEMTAVLSTQLSGALKTVFGVAEAYPNLKSNQNFLELQKRISDIEDMIADRREFYNDSVNNYNIWIEIFPNNIISGMFGAKQKKLFETQEKQNIEVKF